MKTLFYAFVLVMAVLALEPPVYDYAFKVNFD